MFGDCIRLVLLLAFGAFLVYAVPQFVDFTRYGVVGLSGMGGAPR
jgi:hypothetical protein